MSVDPQTHGMNVYRSMLEDEGAHLEDAVRTGIAAALSEAQRRMREDPNTIYHEHEKLRLANERLRGELDRAIEEIARLGGGTA
jgi:hypothetical protein